VISADVVERSPSTIGYGCTAIVDPGGNVVERCPELTTGRIQAALTP
jgi:hypothetical protein